MGKIVKERRFFNILLLILLAGFFVLPNICLADDFENIKLEELSKYLELSGSDSEKLIDSLRQVFTTEGIFLWSSGYTTDEKTAVGIILLNVVKIEILNHLLVDAPIEVIKGIIKTAIEIAKVVLVKDVSDVLDKFEKETVQRAIEYGMKFLLGNEIRVAPGAIKFKYSSNFGGEKEVIFQYVIIYKSINTKKGEVEVKFYSPISVEPPAPNKFSKFLQVPNLKYNLPPFIVEIRGLVEKNEFDNYRWVDESGRSIHPSIDIDFPPEVPDLGIRPLSFWEKQILKPIETTIKEVEIIITKIIGKSLELTKIWNKIKSFISKIINFFPAALVETELINENRQGELENISNIIDSELENLSLEKLIEIESPPSPSTGTNKSETADNPEISLEELQEILDDIAERVDILSQQVSELAEVGPPKTEKETKEIGEIEEFEEEEMVELEESELAEETAQVDKIVLCEKVGQPARNKIIFNEIAWMGTENSANDEWIELKNISGTEINLAGWQLFDKDGQIKIAFTNKGQSPANNLFLLERTDDNSASNAVADLIYTGILNNADEVLYLFDGNCQLQDIAEANPDWPAGDNISKRTMERKYDLIWQASQNPGGTPKIENSSGYYVSSGGGSSYPTPSQPSSPPPSSYPKVLISEVQISPITERFVELYNPNSEAINLTDWYIQRKIGSGEPSSFVSSPNFEGKIINPFDYFLIAHSSSTFSASADILLPLTLTENNTILLKNPNREIVDEISWQEIEEFFSYGLTWNDSANTYSNDFEIQTPTPKIKNQSPQPAPEQPPIASFNFSPESPLVNQEIIFDASSSSDFDGTITSYIWDFGDTATSTEIKATTTHSYSISSDFLVSLIVIDNNNATSGATTTITIFTSETPTLELVINEIQIDSIEGIGGAKDDWVELYNPADEDISLVDWSIQRHNFNGENLKRKSFESTHIIPAKGYFLIVRNEANDNLKMIADMTCSALQLSSSNTVYLVSNDEDIEGGDDPDIVDKVGFGQRAFSPEGNPAPNPPETQSIERKEFGLDTDDNSQDFVINENPSPTNSRGEAGPTFLTNYQVTEDVIFSVRGSPYIIQGDLTINKGKTLTVEPGVTLKFYDNAGLNINGTLKAIGRENKEIIFTSLSDSERWKYINFSSSSADSVLENCLIKNLSYAENQWAISAVSTSIILKNSRIENTATNVLQLRDSSSAIDNLTIEKNSTGAAVEILGGAPEIKNSKFIDTYAGMFIEEGSRAIIEENYFELKAVSPLEPVFVDNSYPVFKNNRGASANALNGISIFGTITQNWQLGKNEDFPYIISSLTNSAGTTLEINPGAVIKFKEEGKLEICGTLKAEGTDDEKILFTSLREHSGEISFASESASSSLKNVILEYGKSSGVVKVSNTNVDFQNTEFRDNNIALLLENSSSTVLNCVFSDNPAISVKINGGNPVIKDSNFSNGNMAIYIEGNSRALIENNSFENFNYSQGTIFVDNSHPLCKGNSGQNNNINGIYLSGAVSEDWTLYKNDIPYVIDYLEVIAGKILEIEAGTIIQLVPYPGVGRMEINGVLKAIGQENNKITFISLSPNSKWDTLHFTSQESTSTLKYVIISNGGRSDKQKGALYLKNAKLELQNVLFDQNYYCLYFENSSRSTISDSEFKNCGYRGVWIEGDCPKMENLILNCPCNFAGLSVPCSTSSESICH